MIYFSCPHCQKTGQAPDELAGAAVTCPVCLNEMMVPHFVISAPAARPGNPAAAPAALAPALTAPADGMIRFLCPHCGKKLKVPASARNTVTNCKRCGQRIDVASASPGASVTPPPTTAASGESVIAYLPDVIYEGPKHYYFIKDNQQFGPVTAAALRHLATTGHLSPDDWVWKPGFSQWKRAAKARGLFPASTPAPRALRQPPPLPPANHATAPPPQRASAAPSANHTPTPAHADTVPVPVRPTGYSEMIRKNPADAGAYVNRGMALAEQDDPDKALADLDAAIRLDPQNAQALAARGLIYAKAKGNYHRGLADLSAAIRFAPNETALYDLRAALYRDLGDAARANADENKASEARSRPG